ncbi:hypothetical protein ACLOJK_005977 [Asimina triloba]
MTENGGREDACRPLLSRKMASAVEMGKMANYRPSIASVLPDLETLKELMLLLLAAIANGIRGGDKKNQRSDDAARKDVGDAAATVDAWIGSIGIDHKNRAMTMLPSRFEMGRRLRPAREGIQPSLRAAAALDGLRSQRIWGQLIVVDVLDGLDHPIKYSPVMSLTEMREMVLLSSGQ